MKLEKYCSKRFADLVEFYWDSEETPIRESKKPLQVCRPHKKWLMMDGVPMLSNHYAALDDIVHQ